MSIELPPGENQFIQELVSAGRFDSKEQAIIEGVRLLIARERVRAKVARGLNDANRGELIDHDILFSELRELAGGFESKE